MGQKNQKYLFYRLVIQNPYVFFLMIRITFWFSVGSISTLYFEHWFSTESNLSQYLDNYNIFYSYFRSFFYNKELQYAMLPWIFLAISIGTAFLRLLWNMMERNVFEDHFKSINVRIQHIILFWQSFTFKHIWIFVPIDYTSIWSL